MNKQKRLARAKKKAKHGRLKRAENKNKQSLRYKKKKAVVMEVEKEK